MNGFQYENNVLQFFPHAEGYVKRNTNNTYLYVYQYKDHLGNIRLSYADVNGNGTIEPASEILEENNYYPFGLKHKGYNEVVNSNRSEAAEKYKFGGKELNDELGLDWYDFGARNYDAAIGRWLNVDPLAEKFIDTTPYSYVYNNPIIFRDPDGKRVVAADIESQNLVLSTLVELLGEKHGFAFNKKGELYHRSNKEHKNSANKYSKEQNNIYKGFLEIMGDKDRTISFFNQSGDDTAYKATFIVESYDFDYVDGIAQRDSQGNFIKKKIKAPMYFEVKHKVKGETGGGAFLTTNESQDYAVSIVFPDIAKNRQFKSQNGFTTPSLSGVVVHELLDHGVDFIRNGNNNNSNSSSINNVNYQNDALIIINSQTRVGHDSH